MVQLKSATSRRGDVLAWTGSDRVSAGLPAFFSNAVFELAHDTDPIRRAVFDLAPIAAGATRTFALPDVSTELAGLSGAQTFDGDKLFAGDLTPRVPSPASARRPAPQRTASAPGRPPPAPPRR